jgi:hypothetical protein
LLNFKLFKLKPKQKAYLVKSLKLLNLKQFKLFKTFLFLKQKLTDQLGTIHTFETSPQRIISLVPSQTGCFMIKVKNHWDN